MISVKVDRHEAAPAHMQVRSHILGLIERGELKAGDQLPGEQDIARLAGVSRMTANKAILSLVSAGWLTREKGRGTFVAEGLLPSEQAISPNRVILTVHNNEGRPEDDYYFGPLYWGIHDAMAEVGLVVEVSRSSVGITVYPTVNNSLVAISPHQKHMRELEAMAKGDGADTPPVNVVVIGASWQSDGLSMVDSDNELGAALAVNHLVDLGHEQIMFVGAEPSDSNTIDRIKGFTFAMKARGLSVSDEDILVAAEATGLDPAVEQELLERLMQSDRPTAVFAAGAKIAVQVVTVASRAGLNVPRDLSVVGYDDPSFLSFTNPPITTVAQPLDAMASFAAQILLDGVMMGKREANAKVFDPELILRESTAPPRISCSLESLS